MLFLGPRYSFLPLTGAATGMHEVIGGVAVEGIAQVGLLEGGGGGGGGVAVAGEVTQANTLAHDGGRRRGGGVSESNTKELKSLIEASTGVMAIVTAVGASAGHGERLRKEGKEEN